MAVCVNKGAPKAAKLNKPVRAERTVIRLFAADLSKRIDPSLYFNEYYDELPYLKDALRSTVK
jgi:hypothetical protein